MAKYDNLREQILVKARHLLVENGYINVSMRKVANLVGCTPTSIYLYFENKDALIHALIEEGMDSLHQKIEECLAATQDSAAQFKLMCRSFLEFGFANPEYYVIMFQLPTDEMAPFPPDKYRRARRNLQEFADVLHKARAEQQPTVDPLIDATMVWSLLHGATSLYLAQRIDTRIPKELFVTRTVDYAISMPNPIHQSS
ncbi:MAG: TetR/AcrR family transcriptional regulator [Planctomycetes bacterium]|nr:TetR/AcrR family transcriptional regulator [Planctomycetota bacterium]